MYKFIQNYNEDESITHIFISIGTNDTYIEFKKTPIKNFITILKQKFPNAAKSIYVIKGLYGYAGIQDGGKDYFGNPIPDIKTKIANYYNIWTSLGAISLKTEVGEVTRHPNSGYPDSMKTIGQEIDDIINTAKPVETNKDITNNPTSTTPS